MDLEIQVPPTWPADARIVFVGEAPGADEVAAKQGWVGAAGRLMQRACAVAKIPWDQAARSNVAKRRPFSDNNNFKKAFYETIYEPIYTPTGKLSKRTRKVVRPTAELESWKDALRRELDEHRVNLVVAAGAEALQAITGHTGILDYRGSVLCAEWNPEIKVLAVAHPSYIQQGNLQDFWILAHDLQKAQREMQFPEIRRAAYREVVAPSLDEVVYHLRYIADNPQTWWTCDVETRAGTLACIGFGYRHHQHGLTGICVPLQLTAGAYWSPEDECTVWEEINYAARSNRFLINQNIEYDLFYLLRHAVEPAGVYMDTMLAHSLLFPEFPKGLDFLCSFYLDDVVYYKGEGRDWSAGDRDEDLWRYNIKDDVHTLRVAEQIDQKLIERGLYEFYHGFSRVSQGAEVLA